ncbi:hypothetical protein L6R52_24090 [Myxococcota bacterium]|nr:hypothetical protein [Myxococcota bacterium]
MTALVTELPEVRPARRALVSSFAALGLTALATVGAAAFVPVTFDSREAVYEIPQGTWAARMAGKNLEILPDEIDLMLEVRDVLVLRNLDDVPQMFGPTLIMPGQTFRLPFEVASEYLFACTAHTSGQMTVDVAERPTTPWARVAWRTETLVERGLEAMR